MSYGKCPKCGAKGISRERRINGNDRCENGHTYPSKDSILEGSNLSLNPRIEKLEEMHKAAMELAEYASYAEIIGAVSKNRNPIREWCDKIFEIHALLD
jgi:hypothetical protein